MGQFWMTRYWVFPQWVIAYWVGYQVGSPTKKKTTDKIDGTDCSQCVDGVDETDDPDHGLHYPAVVIHAAKVMAHLEQFQNKKAADIVVEERKENRG
jgi:hypothetical protein